MRKIQSRNHSKALEVLLYSDKFVVVAGDLDDHLYRLMNAFKKVEVSLCDRYTSSSLGM